MKGHAKHASLSGDRSDAKMIPITKKKDKAAASRGKMAKKIK